MIKLAGPALTYPTDRGPCTCGCTPTPNHPYLGYSYGRHHSPCATCPPGICPTYTPSPDPTDRQAK